jgi:hypothetical protein
LKKGNVFDIRSGGQKYVCGAIYDIDRDLTVYGTEKGKETEVKEAQK